MANSRGHAAPASAVLDGDLCGFPNGRRLVDDVTDIELRAIAQGYGTFLNGAFALPNRTPNNQVGDGVDSNADMPFLAEFPYIGLPHSATSPCRRWRGRASSSSTSPMRLHRRARARSQFAGAALARASTEAGAPSMMPCTDATSVQNICASRDVIVVNSDRDLLVQVSRLYYELGETQNAVADRLGLTRPQVSRL